MSVQMFRLLLHNSYPVLSIVSILERSWVWRTIKVQLLAGLWKELRIVNVPHINRNHSIERCSLSWSRLDHAMIWKSCVKSCSRKVGDDANPILISLRLRSCSSTLSKEQQSTPMQPLRGLKMTSKWPHRIIVSNQEDTKGRFSLSRQHEQFGENWIVTSLTLLTPSDVQRSDRELPCARDRSHGSKPLRG